MATPIKNKDLIQEGIFDDFIKSAEDALKITEALEKEFKETAKTFVDSSKKIENALEGIKIDKPTIESLNDLGKAADEVRDMTKTLVKVQEQEAKILTQLNSLRKGEQDELIKSRIEVQELTKQKKAEAKTTLGLVSEYQKQSKRLRELKNDYKDLILSEGKATKETKKLLKQITKLDNELVDLDDSVNDSFRSIGKYEKAIERLEKDMLKLAAAGAAVVGSFQGVKGSLEASEEGSEDLRKVTSQLDAGFNVFKNTVATAALDIFNFGKNVANGEVTLTSISAAFNKTSRAIDTFGERVENATSSAGEAEQAQIDLEKSSRSLLIQVAQLSGEIEKQNIIAGDTTKGMDSIALAIERALVAEQARNAILVELAERELKIINDRIKAQGEGANSLDLLNQQSEKQIELIGLRIELDNAGLELDKERALNNRDRFEKELDFALDLFDTQKTLNERQIADETKTFEERINLLARTTELADKAFAEQTRLAEKQVGARLKLNELVAKDDEAIIFARINALTQDEIVQQRLLDIVRDRKTAVLDLADAEKELALAIRESGQEGIDAANELAQFRLDRRVELAEDLDAREVAELESAQFRFDVLLANEKLLADQRTLIEEQLQAELTDIKKRAEEERLEIAKQKILEETQLRREQQKQLIDAASQITGEVGKELQERNDQLIASLDKEIESREASLERQKELGENAANEQISFEEEKLNEATLKRQEALEKQQQQQEAVRLAEVFLTSLEARLSTAQNQQEVDLAPARALADTFGARAIAKGFLAFAGAFKEGVEDLEGAGTETSDSNLALLSKGESVATAKGTRENKGLVTAMNKGSVDEWVNMHYGAVSGNVFTPQDNELTEEVKGLRQDIKLLPTSDLNGDKVGNIIQTIKIGGSKRIIYHKINPLQ